MTMTALSRLHIFGRERSFATTVVPKFRSCVRGGCPARRNPSVLFGIRSSDQKANATQITLQVFEPKESSDVQAGTTTRAKATCPCCNTTMSPERVRVQLAANKGGGDVIFDATGKRVGGARMLAVVTLKEGQVGRKYRVSLDSDYRPVWKASEQIEKVSRDVFPNGLHKIPDEPLPTIGTLGFRVQRYGLVRWGDLFTARQKLTLTSLLEILRGLEYRSPEARDVAALALSRLTDIFNGLLLWSSSADQVVHLFGRQAIPMVWDFSEPSPLGQGAGDYTVTLRTMIRVIRDFPPSMPVGRVQIADATRYPLPHESASVWFTDPHTTMQSLTPIYLISFLCG